MYILGYSHKIVHQIIYIYIYSVKYFRENSRIFLFSNEYPEERCDFACIYGNTQQNTKIQRKTPKISLYFCENPRYSIIPEENRVFHSVLSRIYCDDDGKTKIHSVTMPPTHFQSLASGFLFARIIPPSPPVQGILRFTSAGLF